MVKITGGQRIDLLGVRKEDLPGVWADLDMPSGYAYGKCFRTVKTCVGTDFCRFGAGRLDRRSASRLEQTLPGPGEPGEDEARRGRLPAQLRRGASQGRRGGRRRRRPVGVYVGGAAGRARPQGRPAGDRRRARRGDPADRAVHAVLPRERQVAGAHVRLRAAGRARRAQGDPGRRPRRASSPAWRSGCRRPIDAYRDPWQDGREPSGPGQFANNLPLLPLPIVPVGRAPDGSLQASSAGRGPAASGPFASGAGTVSDYEGAQA